MNSEEKKLLEDVLFHMNAICTILCGFLEARKAEEAKPRDPFREYWEAHQEDRQNSKLKGE